MFKRLHDRLASLITKDSGSDDYGRSIRAAVRGLWSGAYSVWEFESAMSAAIELGLRRAWYAGASECGIYPEDLSQDELNRLDQEIIGETSQILDFGLFIMYNSKLNGGKLTPLMTRAQMWVNRYEAVRGLAREYACADQKLKWIRGNTMQPCRDCLRLDGRVYRASTWRKYGIEPRMHSLQCGGFRCRCELIPTDEPSNRGRPPRVG